MTPPDTTAPPRCHAVILDPLRTVSESNMREHWARKAARAKTQRSTVYTWLRHLLPPGPSWTLPLTVTLTRVAPRLLDPADNLPGSQKHVADGVSDYLAGGYLKGQDRQEGLTWHYAQRRGQPRQYAVEITLEEQR